LESTPLTWLESLKPNSIDSWEDLKRAFTNNFQGSIIRAGTRHDVSQVKQEMNKTLRSYTQCFFEIRATIANITDEDIICCFQNGLFSKHTYHDFRRNHLTTAVELCDMMAWWADLENKENDRFPKCNSEKQGNGNNHFDKGQRNHLGYPQKCKPDQEVVAVECNPHGKKLGNNEAQFEKVLHKQHRCTRSHDICSSSESASVSHSTLHTFPKPESERTRRMRTRVTSRGLKIFRTRRMSSTSSSVEMAASPPSAHRS
jgi:hypothetical protein